MSTCALCDVTESVNFIVTLLVPLPVDGGRVFEASEIVLVRFGVVEERSVAVILRLLYVLKFLIVIVFLMLFSLF